jgi:hypothetical protein
MSAQRSLIAGMPPPSFDTVIYPSPSFLMGRRLTNGVCLERKTASFAPTVRQNNQSSTQIGLSYVAHRNPQATNTVLVDVYRGTMGE